MGSQSQGRSRAREAVRITIWIKSYLKRLLDAGPDRHIELFLAVIVVKLKERLAPGHRSVPSGREGVELIKTQ
jgi:hypothetical protein